MKLSVIIPAYHEPYLVNTLKALIAATRLGSDLEILVVLDGPWYTGDDLSKIDPRIKVIQLDENIGMRGAINTGLSVAQGECIMKVDAHCVFELESFTERMLDGLQDENWLVVPRQYALNVDGWQIGRIKNPRDYHFFKFPGPDGIMSIHPYKPEQIPELIVDTLIMQGSCWCAVKEVFMRKVGKLDDREDTYGSFAAEQLEIGLKYWLSGGAIKTLKGTWYGHLKKQSVRYRADPFARKKDFRHNWYWSAKHWLRNEEPGMIYPLSWLLEKFWPVPTWPEDRRLWEVFNE